MLEDYTRNALENRVAKYYEDLYEKTFPAGGANRPASITDLDPMLRAFEHRFRGEGYSEALADLNRIDASLSSWGHYQRLIEMRTELEDDDVGSRLSDRDRGQNLGRLGVAYLYLGQRPKAESCLKTAESKARDCKDPESEGLWLIYRALNSTMGGEIQAAKEFLDSAEKKVSNEANKAKRIGIEGYISSGVLGYNDVMQAKETLRCYNEAVDRFDKIRVEDLDVEERASGERRRLHRARCYSVLGQHKAAEADFDKSRKNLEALDNQRALVFWDTLKASADREMGKLAQAKKALERAQRVSIATGDRRGEQITNSLLGKVYRDAAWAIRIREGDFTDEATGHLHASAHYFERALELERKLGNKPRLVIVLRRLGNVRRELSRAVKVPVDAKNFADLAQENYAEAKKIADTGRSAPDPRAVIYDWLEKARWALSVREPGKFPDAKDAFEAQKKLRSASGPVVVPPVELEMGIVLLHNRDARGSKEDRESSAESAFVDAGELLERALADLARDEKRVAKNERNVKRWAEINYALGTALVGQAVLAAKKDRAELEDQARRKFEEVLSAYMSSSLIRDTFQDLISIKGAVRRSTFVDECLELFRENWHPEEL